MVSSMAHPVSKSSRWMSTLKVLGFLLPLIANRPPNSSLPPEKYLSVVKSQHKGHPFLPLSRRAAFVTVPMAGRNLASTRALPLTPPVGAPASKFIHSFIHFFGKTKDRALGQLVKSK